MLIQWSGPTAGLGNRMLALASASAVSQLLETEIVFSWINSSTCPCDYTDLFYEIPGLKETKSFAGNSIIVETDRWNPVRIIKDFEKALGVKLDEEAYYHNFIKSLRTIRYSKHVRQKISDNQKSACGQSNLAIHVRRTDRLPHHKTIYRHKTGAFRIIRNTGVIKSVQYLLLNEAKIRLIENTSLLKLLKRFLSEHTESTYSFYCDSYDDLKGIRKFFYDSGISDKMYYHNYSESSGDSYWGQYGMRNTLMIDALVELIEMAGCDYIAQNNPASTFSLVASIIGNVKIISKQPTHEFWRKIQAITGKPPNAIFL